MGERARNSIRRPPPRVGSVRATVEALPPRTLLSMTPAMATVLEAHGFERVTWRHRDVYVEPGEWIVSIGGMRGRAEDQVRLADAKLRRLGKGLHAVGQLGRDGLFKVDAPRGMNGDTLRSALRNVRNFQSVEPNAAVWAQGVFDERNDPLFVSQYGLNNTGGSGGTPDADIDAPEAWAIAGGDAEEVVVGVIDTGVDYTHPDLAASMWTNEQEVPGNGRDDDDNGFIDDVHGADFAYLDGDPMDDHGHGTHVASIIAAQANNSLGGSGVAPNAKIMALRFLDASGFGGTDSAIRALNYAMDMKSRGVNIRVTNNSWGSSDNSPTLEQAIHASGDAGMLFVAAAGNGGADQIGDNNDVEGFFPSSYPTANIIAVTATDNHDALVRLSNYGPASVDLAAPGHLILGAFPNNGYGYMTGTSMAAPLVSGVAALAFGLHPDATWQVVHGAILGSVDPLPAMAGKTVTGGRLNAASTLRALSPAAVVGRQLFYNNSGYDGRSTLAGPEDDAAVATDKAALLPGQVATYANYTSYSKGINGVMVDLRGATGTVGPGDFAVAVRNASGDWDAGPAPSVAVRPGAGVGGYDRVTLTWNDGAIKNTWLRVTVLTGGATGLALDDVFYFGNAIGETGNSATDAVVNAADYAATRSAQRTGPAAIDAPCDFNRDGLVNAVDLSIVRSHQTSATLPLITAPPAILPGATAAASAPASTVASASVFSGTRIRPYPMKVMSVATILGAM